MKTGFDLQWFFGFNIEKNDGALLVYRNKKCLAHGESVIRVKNCGRLRPNSDGPRQRFCWKNASFGVKFQVKFAKNLERIDPHFHSSRFVPEKSGTSYGNGK